MAHDADDTEAALREQLLEQLSTLESVNAALADSFDAELCDVPPLFSLISSACMPDTQINLRRSAKQRTLRKARKCVSHTAFQR